MQEFFKGNDLNFLHGKERDKKIISNINLMLKYLTGLSGKVKCLKQPEKPLLQVYRLICQSDPS